MIVSCYKLILYIDPSTGSMLFAVLLGLVSTVVFAIKSFMMKIKYGGGLKAKQKLNDERYDVVIYSDHKRYDTTFEGIIDELDKTNYKIVFYTMSEDDLLLKKSYNKIKCEYLPNNAVGFSKLNNINAKICISTTPGLDVYQWKRSKHCDKYIHIYHALEPNGATYRMFGIDFYDEIWLPSMCAEPFIRELENKRGEKPKIIESVGIPYMDEMLKKKQKAPTIKNEKPLILVAPSWGKSSILDKYGSAFIDKLIETGYDIVIRPHPQSRTQNPKLLEELTLKYKYVKNLSWNYDNDNFDILNKSDILISDFSAVAFDYLFIFGKPLIITDVKKDKDEYDEWWLENQHVYEDIFDKVSYKLEENNFSDIKKLIDNALLDKTNFKNVLDVRNRIWEHIGESEIVISDKIISYLYDKNSVNV